MIKISGFTDEVSSSLDEQIATLNELNQHFMCPRDIDGKNIAAYTPDEFMQKVKPVLDKNNIGFSSIGSPVGKVGLYDDEGYAAQLGQLKNLVKIAEATGCRYIRTFSFFVDPKGDYGKYFPKVVEKVRGFLEVVKGTDVVLLHENEKKIFGDTPERVLKLCREIDDPQYKLCYDASNYIQCGVDPWAAFEATKPFTVYYHMKDCIDGREVPLGIGQGNIKRVVGTLVREGYDGFLTLEPHTAFYAVAKIPFYLCPPLSLFLKHSIGVYRRIDKAMRVRAFEKVSRKRCYLWQYEKLTEILKEAGADYE